jgi:hypothetical protein
MVVFAFVVAVVVVAFVVVPRRNHVVGFVLEARL